MFKWYADITELDEAALTPKALRRIYFFLILSVPFFPLLTLGHLHLLEGGAAAKTLYWVTMLISGAATVCLFFTRIINRVWVQDKYLDEWEKAVKHKSMSVGFMVLTYTLAILFSFGFLYHDVMEVNLPDINLEILGFAAIGAVFFGVYVQIIQQLAMILPMEEDALSRGNMRRTSIRPIVIGIIAIILGPLLLIYMGAFIAGFIDGFFGITSSTN